MKKITLTAVCGFVFFSSLVAQEFKIAKNAGRLEFKEVNNVSIEGYAGNEIVFTSQNGSRDKDPRAEGLRAISSMGLEDNTGLGLSVADNGNVVEVRQLKKTDGPDIRVMVPKGIAISYTHSSPYGKSLEIKNFDGEIQVSTVHNGVVLNNTTGKISVKTVHGDIDASLASSPNAAVSLESVHGHVDAALPVSTKASLLLSTNWGEVMVDPDFKLELESSGDMVKYSDKIRGKLNGGGTELALTSHHNNVYLRKK